MKVQRLLVALTLAAGGLAAVASGCTSDDVSYEGKSCDPATGCPAGFSCDPVSLTCKAVQDAGSTGTPDAGPGPADAATTLQGQVVDMNGGVVASATVVISGQAATATDSQGRFSTPMPAGAYDALIGVPGKVGVLYKGLHRSDPVLRVTEPIAPQRSSQVTGVVAGGSGDGYALVFMSPTHVQECGPVNATTGAFDCTVRWYGATSITGSMHALRFTKVGELPQTYTGYGKIEVTLNDGVPQPGSNVPLQAVETGHIEGTSAPLPTGVELGVRALGLVLENRTALLTAEMKSTTYTIPDVFSYATPKIAGATFAVAGMVTAAGYGFTTAWRTGLAPDATGVTFNYPAPPTVAQPAAGATGVTTATPFVWSNVPGALYALRLQPTVTTQPKFVVFTAETSAQIPDLSSYGVALPASAGYAWSVWGYAPMTVDDFAGPKGSWIARPYFDLGAFIGTARNLTTAP